LTLIELVVALAIFLVVLIVATSIFLTAIKNQRKAFVTQNLQDNTRYIIEAMTKEIRMSQIISTVNGKELDILAFSNLFPDGQAVKYKFESNKITRNTEQINSAKVEINGDFYLGTTSQPKVTIVMRVKPAGASQPEIKVQNTISSRSY